MKRFVDFTNSIQIELLKKFRRLDNKLELVSLEEIYLLYINYVYERYGKLYFIETPTLAFEADFIEWLYED